MELLCVLAMVLAEELVYDCTVLFQRVCRLNWVAIIRVGYLKSSDQLDQIIDGC